MQRNQSRPDDDDEGVPPPVPSFLSANELAVKNPAPHVLKDTDDEDADQDEGDDATMRTPAKAPARKKPAGKSR